MLITTNMRQYTIDQLSAADHAGLQQHLVRHFPGPGMEGLYWVPLEPDLLAAPQRAHPACQPFYFARELLPDRLVCELLVRTRQRVRCDCVAYADRRQREWLMALIDDLLATLGVNA